MHKGESVLRTHPNGVGEDKEEIRINSFLLSRLDYFGRFPRGGQTSRVGPPPPLARRSTSSRLTESAAHPNDDTSGISSVQAGCEMLRCWIGYFFCCESPCFDPSATLAFDNVTVTAVTDNIHASRPPFHLYAGALKAS